jgi:hypothetical protein
MALETCDSSTHLHLEVDRNDQEAVRGNLVADRQDLEVVRGNLEADRQGQEVSQDSAVNYSENAGYPDLAGSVLDACRLAGLVATTIVALVDLVLQVRLD